MNPLHQIVDPRLTGRGTLRVSLDSTASGVNTMRFYKFRAVGDDLTKDYAIKGLLESYAIFSSRKNFNDLFDSKIDIPHPTPEQILELQQDPRIGSHATFLNGWVADGAFTPKGILMLNNAETVLNELFDSYALFSLSSHIDCPLLWAHYASSHTGFCIELEFPSGNQPNQVNYREHIETVPLLDFIKSWFKLTGTEFGERIHDALLVKMDYWAYEGEYRWMANNEMGRVPKDAKFISIFYEPQWVKAIIFGCRTPTHVKTYIRERLPFATEFKQAIEAKDHIEIVPYSEDLHL